MSNQAVTEFLQELLRSEALREELKQAEAGQLEKDQRSPVEDELLRVVANVRFYLDLMVSFHGNLDTPNPEDAKNILGKVLVQHGAADPHVDQEQVMAFWDEMNNANVDWYMTAYGGAVHSFTNPAADSLAKIFNMPIGYNKAADEKSWSDMVQFFKTIFKS